MTITSNKFLVTRIDFLTKDLLNFELKCSHITWNPGQYLVLELQQGVTRSYSIRSVKLELGSYLLDFYVKIRSGIGSQFLKNLKVGDSLQGFGPFGDFAFIAKAQRQIAVSTGTGVAPIASWLPEINLALVKGETQHLYFIQAADSLKELIIRKQFLELASRWEGRVWYTFLVNKCMVESNITLKVTKHQPVTIERVLSHIDPRKEDNLYVCGNPHLVNKLMTYYSSKCLVVTEAFG